MGCLREICKRWFGQMYDNEKYGKIEDSGFSLFYMFINIGAIFAPMAAVGVRNWWLVRSGFRV